MKRSLSFTEKQQMLIEENSHLQNELSRAERDMGRRSEYFSIVSRLMRDEFQAQDRWTIMALTRLVNFAAIRLEPATIEKFPEYIIEFLTDDFFNYPYVGFFLYDKEKDLWTEVIAHGETSIDVSDIPVFEDNMILEEEKEVYSFFSLLEESYLIIVSVEGQMKKLSSYEHSFVSMFTTLVSSFFQMKKLSRDVEERMVEMSTMRTSTNLINKLNEETISLTDAFTELGSSLALDGLVLGLLDADNEMRIALAGGIAVRDWQEFLHDVLVKEELFTENWEIYPLHDEKMIVHGAVAFKFSRSNYALSTIQRRVLENTIPRITNYLSQKQFHNQSITDELTGIFNRRHILKTLRERTQIALGDKRRKLAIAMADIDHFKAVNDTYGHQAGDEVLKKVAALISDTLRDTDCAGRYGGEEFIVLLEADEDGARLVAERIRKRVEELSVTLPEHTLSVTISMGVCALNEGLDANSLVNCADQALYQAKESGRNQVVVFSQ